MAVFFCLLKWSMKRLQAVVIIIAFANWLLKAGLILLGFRTGTRWCGLRSAAGLINRVGWQILGGAGGFAGTC